MAGPLPKGRPPRRGRARTPGSWARWALTAAQSWTGRGATGLCDPTRRHWGPTGWRGNRVLLRKKKKRKKIWVREQDSGSNHSRPLAPNRLPESLPAEPICPEPPKRGTRPRAAEGRLGPSRGRSGSSEAHPERGLVTFHRRLASSPAQLCPPHEAIMASSAPRLEKAAAGQRAGHGVGQRGEAAPDNQPHSHGRKGNARASPPAPNPTAAAGS